MPLTKIGLAFARVPKRVSAEGLETGIIGCVSGGRTTRLEELSAMSNGHAGAQTICSRILRPDGMQTNGRVIHLFHTALAIDSGFERGARFTALRFVTKARP